MKLDGMVATSSLQLTPRQQTLKTWQVSKKKLAVAIALKTSQITALQAASRGFLTRRKMRSKWKSTKSVIRSFGSLLRNVRIKRMSELPLAIAMGGSVATKVESEEALGSMKLWEQGDEALYTREALEARYRNRSDKRVWKWLDIWWTTAMEHGGLNPADGCVARARATCLHLTLAECAIDLYRAPPAIC